MATLLTLLDIDECLTSKHTCHDNATCTDTDGSYNCTCNTGYEGDGVNCTGICIEYHSPPTVPVAKTYQADGLFLLSLDINECVSAQDNCHTYASCTNTAGSFYCMCDSGYEGDGVNCSSKTIHTV